MNTKARLFLFHLANVIGLVALLLGLVGCAENLENRVDISCAPQTLEKDQWAVLSILETSNDKLGPRVVLNSKKLESEALFGRVAETSGVVCGGRCRYRLQVFQIQPQHVGGVVEITLADFENLPENTIDPEIKIEFVESMR